MAADILNLFGAAAIEQYADYSITLDDIALDLTGYTGRATLKKSYNSPTGTEFAVEFVSRNLPAVIRLSLTHAQTAALTPGRYWWDLYIQSPGETVTRLCEGKAMVKPGVSESA